MITRSMPLWMKTPAVEKLTATGSDEKGDVFLGYKGKTEITLQDNHS
ncbi:MAG: hypothetical protein HC806_03755 [Anaerolineae bacterium]|nr:hypothetical protein [Anaerolineae bacterium]